MPEARIYEVLSIQLLSMQPVLLLKKLLLLLLRLPLNKLPPPDKLLLTLDKMWIPPLQHLLLAAPAQGVVVPAVAMLDRQVQGAQLLHPRWPTQARRGSGPLPSTSPSQPPLTGRRPVKWRMHPCPLPAPPCPSLYSLPVIYPLPLLPFQ